jgi:hypothetical protein
VTGVILCEADADCPGLAPHCCGAGNFRICRARACRGGGAGGPGGGNGSGAGRGPGG